MAEHKRIRNFNVLSGFSWYIPGAADIFALLLFLLGGALLGNVVAGCFLLAGMTTQQDIVMLVSYPIMFIPAMIYASLRSKKNSMFDSGCSIDSDAHFGKGGFALCGLLVILATIALSFLTDIINAQMPEMPQWLEDQLKAMTSGNFFLNFICVSLMAPFFEEWLCRGMVLRGLLNYKRKKKDGSTATGIKPVWAIFWSAVFFAFIHLNPWQAVPAFILGCLFGYVYYRTGSLKLTMLMHFTNNTFSLIFSNIDKFKDAKTFFDIMSPIEYGVVAVVCMGIVILLCRTLNRIELNSPQGNCDTMATLQ